MNEPMRCRGMRDMLPADMARFRRIEQAFREVCLGWGYQEVRTPTIEPLHLFTAAGTLSSQMLGRVYSFLDWDGWSGERVVLRPDSTIPAARLSVEQGVGQRCAKLFYVQNVFRFATGDESREDWQCGVELIGDTQPQGDVELILMALETLQRLGLSATVKLSDPGILRRILVKAGLTLHEQAPIYDRVLDGDLTALDEVQQRLPGSAPVISGLLSIEGDGVNYLNNLRSALTPIAEDLAQPLDELAAVSRVLEQIGYAHTIQPLLVRDFEYYTGPVFHLFVDGKKAGGGGRYDGLISLIGDGEVPASGFALEMEALMGLLPEAPSPSAAGVAIRCNGRNGPNLAAAFALAQALREAGRRVELAGGATGTQSQEVLVSADGFTLTNGAREGRRMTRIEEVIEALSGDPHD